MYGIYDDIISAAEKASAEFLKTEELLEYPEVQADKAYYLSVLSEYNRLKAITDKLNALKQAITDEAEAFTLLKEAKSDGERDALYAEISSAKRTAAELSVFIANALGCKHVQECAYLRFKFTAAASKLGERFYLLIRQYLTSRGVRACDEKREYTNGGALCGVSLTAEGEDIISRLSPLTGAHKVYVSGGKSEELCFAVTPAEEKAEFSENDVKIDLVRSSGAGGQHINKVETAVRVTHIPTGITVTCQDERSQLSNKLRALEAVKKRVLDARSRSEKSRMDADVYAQYRKKNTPISFDLELSTMTDTRLNGYKDVAFPPEDFSAYIDRLITL